MIEPAVLAGLAAVSRVSGALAGADELPVLAGAALQEMREALDLDRAVLYLPDADGQPVLRRYVGDAAADELSFDEEAWRLATGGPIVLREPAGWLVDEPVRATGRRLDDPAARRRRRDRLRTRADRDRRALGHRPEPDLHAAQRRDHDRAAAAGAAGGGDRARAPHAGRRGARRARAVPRRRAARAGAARPRTGRGSREAVEAAHRLVRERLRTLVHRDAGAACARRCEAAARRARTPVRIRGHGDAGPEASRSRRAW